VTKTEQLNLLFQRWQQECPEYQGKFHKDGIVNEETYLGQNPKVLFIAKEPNNPDQGEFDFREWWAEEVKYGFAHRVCEWAFGFSGGFPPLENLSNSNEERIQVMRRIAFMNLKKTGGSSYADSDLIMGVVERERQFLQAEISVINPDVIIGGIGNPDIWNLLFPGMKLVRSGFDIWVGRHNSFRIIDFYHPSYQVPRAMSYCLLASVYSSEVFKKL